MLKQFYKILLSVTVAVIIFTSVIFPERFNTNKGDLNMGNFEDSENTQPQDSAQNDTQSETTHENGTAAPDDNEATSGNNVVETVFTYTDTGIKVQSLVNLNIRKHPQSDGEKVGYLNTYDTAIYLETHDNNWYKIVYKNAPAYVSSNTQYTRLVDSNNINTADLIIDKVVQQGMSILGTPYEFGSQRILNWNGTLNNNFTGKTYDCSAFIQYIFYKGANVKLKGDSRSQSTQGLEIKLSNVKRGDILIMTSTARQYNTGIERIGHVALYLGNNKILHTFGTGGVRIQDFSAFWKGRVITVRRVV